jgi:hypothetical protein
LPGAQGRIVFAWLVCNRHRAAPREGTHWIAEQHHELVNRYIREFLSAQGFA